jgi:hypothetical protein
MAAFLVLAAVLGCAAVREPASEAGLLHAEHRWVRALERRDRAALDCLLAADFIDHDWRGGVRHRQDLLEALARRPEGARIGISDLTAHAGAGLGYVQGLTTGPEGKARFTDVFQYREGRWIAVAARETAVTD